MLHLKEYSVWVVVAGTPAQEFGVEVLDGQSKATCWIPSEEGKAFEIRIKDNTRHRPTNAKIYVDGTSYGCKYFHGDKLAEYCKQGMRTSLDSVRPFVFSRLNTTDDESAACNPSPDIGEIKVVIRHGTLTPHSRGGLDTASRAAPIPLTVHEQTKKGIDHQTTLGQEILSRTSYSKSQSYGPPVATFYFRYRPIGILQANGVAPLPERRKRARSQEVKLESEDVIDISSDSGLEELGRLRARVRTLEGRQQERALKKVKRELSVKREPIVGDVIDLTEL